LKIFLKAKAWQLFIVFLAPMSLPAFFFPTVTKALIGLVYFLWMLAVFGWIYSVGTACNRLLSKRLTRNPLLYNLSFIYLFAYSVLCYLLLFNPVRSGQMTIFPSGLMPLPLIGMFLAFYAFWFTARQFSSWMKNAEVTFLEYSGVLFLFWFSPIGVWFVQPKINQLVKDDS